MKRYLALLLALCLLLCGCSAKQPEPTQPSTEAATEPATEPTTEPPTEPPTEPEPVYTNPLNGEILDAPFEDRIYAVTVANIPDSLPHVGVTHADILMEMFVNHSIVRCLALYTQPEKAETIGSVRSTRLMFDDITQHYGAVLFHAGGSSQVLADAAERGIQNYNIDAWANQAQGVSVRDNDRNRYIGWEHCLVAIGPELKNFADNQGVPTVAEDADFGLLFTEDGTPADGEAADTITIKLVFGRSSKETVLEYDPQAGKYHYGGIFYTNKIMHTDQVTKEPELFENVVVMYADITLNGIYHTADFLAGGYGYYACGGKIIPIFWTCEGEDQPFRFFHEDDLTRAIRQLNDAAASMAADRQLTEREAAALSGRFRRMTTRELRRTLVPVCRGRNSDDALRKFLQPHFDAVTDSRVVGEFSLYVPISADPV